MIHCTSCGKPLMEYFLATPNLPAGYVTLWGCEECGIATPFPHQGNGVDDAAGG